MTEVAVETAAETQSVTSAPQHQEQEREPAVQTFLERVRHIAGVRAIEQFSECSIRVSVPDQLGETGSQVYDLEDEVRGQYPGTRLDVWVSEAS